MNPDSALSSSSVVRLAAGDLRLEARADLGGSIAGLWLEELPVLRSTEADALASARLSACFPLAPYSNRLGFRRFRWHGEEHTTAPNFEGSPHSLHGVAWLREWHLGTELFPPVNPSGMPVGRVGSEVAASLGV